MECLCGAGGRGREASSFSCCGVKKWVVIGRCLACSIMLYAVLFSDRDQSVGLGLGLGLGRGVARRAYLLTINRSDFQYVWHLSGRARQDISRHDLLRCAVGWLNVTEHELMQLLTFSSLLDRSKTWWRSGVPRYSPHLGRVCQHYSVR